MPIEDDAHQSHYNIRIRRRSHLSSPGGGARTQHLGDWVWSPDGITKLAYINEQTPQLGHYFKPIGSPINNLGQQLRGAPNQAVAGILPAADSLWLLDPNVAPHLLAKVGDAAPGLPSGITLATQFDGNFLNSGEIIFRMMLAGLGVNATNNIAFWLGDDQGNFELIFRAGQQAPGLPPGVLIDPTSFGVVRMLGSGSVQVQSFLRGLGVTSNSNFAVWSYGEEGMKLLAKEGDQAPGLADGVTFSTLSPALSSLVGPGINRSNDFGIWLQQHGGFELVLARGSMHLALRMASSMRRLLILALNHSAAALCRTSMSGLHSWPI